MYDPDNYSGLYDPDHPSAEDLYGPERASSSDLNQNLLDFPDAEYDGGMAYGENDQYYGSERDEYYDRYGVYGDDDYALMPPGRMMEDCIESDNKANLTSASTLHAHALFPR
jgi:hypothetical protein